MRYLRLFVEQGKMTFMSATIYKANFILMLIQSIINTLANVLCIEFIYSSVSSIAGWKKDEMIILICTSLIINQLYRGIVLPNQNAFVKKVNNGSFDLMLLKPMNIVYQINIGLIDISSLLSCIAPVIILCYKLTAVGIKAGLIHILIYICLVIIGCIILSSFMMMLFSLAFRFIKVDKVVNIYYTMMSLAEKPKEIFGYKSLISTFTFIIPVIPLASIPTEVLLKKVNLSYCLISIIVAVQFLILAHVVMKKGLKNYSSASS